jgi:hypothetical protein
MLPSGQKLTLGLLNTIALELASFRTTAIFLSAYWKSCFVRVRFCLDHLNCVKMAAFQFCLQLTKQRKSGWVRTTHMLCFLRNVYGEKGSVRWCVVVMKKPVLLSPKFGAKSLHILTQST